MKNYILVAFVCFTTWMFAQTSSGTHHIKYLDINSGNPDIGVSFIEDDKLIFTTATTDKVVNIDKRQPHLDLYEGEVDDEGVVTNKRRIEGAATKKVSKVGATFTKDGKTVYYAANKYAKRSRKKPRYEIYVASIDSLGNWYNTQKVSFNDKRSSASYPALDAENKRLYFASDREGSLGRNDIYYVDILGEREFSTPVNLGDKVNTSGNEITPFIASNNFLYFSSDGRDDTLGKLDVYAAELFENTVSEPLHLASPVNGVNDDFSYIVNENNKGFFSSNRLQGRANDDIYSFYIEPDEPEECLQEIVGTVREDETEQLVANAIVKVVDDKGNEVQSSMSDENGGFSFSLNCSNTYTVRTTKESYSVEEHIVNTANYTSPPPLEVNQFLSKAEAKLDATDPVTNVKTGDDKVKLKETIDKKIVVDINPIYFDFDKFNISNKAKVELDKIVRIMKENPELMIEAGSHTDSWGPKYYNQKLSERRAKATVDYIVSKGIDRERIQAKGYGESQLLNGCKSGVRCSIKQHRLNRRTEFVVLNKQALYEPVVASKNTTTVASSAPNTSNTNDEGTSENSVANTVEDSVKPAEAQDAVEVIAEETQQNSDVTVENETTENDEETPEKVDEEELNEDEQFQAEATQENLIENQPQKNTQQIAENKVENKTTPVDSKKKRLASKSKTTDSVIKSDSEKKTIVENSFSEEDENHNQDTNSEHHQEELVTENFSESEDNYSSENTTSEYQENSVTQNFSDANQASLTESTEQEYGSSTLIDEDDLEPEGQEMTFNRDLSCDDPSHKNSSKLAFGDEDDYYEVEKDDTQEVINSITNQMINGTTYQSASPETKNKVLEINSVDVTPLAIKRNGKYVETTTANKTDVMRINFQISDNENVTPGCKEVYILIQNPEGEILNKKGVFAVCGLNQEQELMYTEKADAHFYNDKISVAMVTDRFIQKITKGRYTIMIYIEGYPVGLQTVVLS